MSALVQYLARREADLRPGAPEGPTHPWFPFIASTTSDALYGVDDGRWWCSRPTTCVKRLDHGGACVPASDFDWHHHPRAWQPREVWERMGWLKEVAA